MISNSNFNHLFKKIHYIFMILKGIGNENKVCLIFVIFERAFKIIYKDVLQLFRILHCS